MASDNRVSVSQPLCYCGSRAAFDVCCGAYLRGEAIPVAAQQLMRSRYCGFVLEDEPYLLATWHVRTRPSKVRFDDDQRWLGLRIMATDAGGAQDARGTVEFVARFKVAGRGHRLHEISRFEKVQGRWFYCDGQHL